MNVTQITTFENENYYHKKQRSIPVRSFFGDLNKKSPLGMIRGCQSDELTPNLDTKEDYT